MCDKQLEMILQFYHGHSKSLRADVPMTKKVSLYCTDLLLSRVSLVEMVDVSWFLDHVAGGVIQICVEFGFLHHSQSLLLQEFDLFRDDPQLAARHRPRAFVRLLDLRENERSEKLNDFERNKCDKKIQRFNG